MRNHTATLIFVLALSVVSFAQDPPDDEKPRLGSVSGRITIAGKPAVGAFVRLPSSDFEPGQPRQRSAVTDSEGRYEIADVRPGRYFLSPYTPGYTGPNLGWGYAGMHVTVAPGEAVKNADVALERGGAITGRVTDHEGRAVVRQPVLVQSVDEAGKRTAVEVPNMQFMATDDRGIYRIYGLPAGKYVVSVGLPPGQNLMFVASDSRRGFAVTYYPGTTNDAEARAVSVTPGGEVKNVDIPLGKPVVSYVVTGKLTGIAPGSAEASAYYVTINPAVDGRAVPTEMGRGAAPNEKGEFRVEGITPGTYAASASGFMNPGATLYSEPTIFRVTDSDVQGVEIAMRAGATVTGVLEMADGTDPALLDKLSTFGVAATFLADGAEPSGLNFSESQVGPDGSFRLTGIQPGTAKLLLGDYNAPKGFSIVRIERDGSQVRNEFALSAGETLSGIRIVIGFGKGIIRGEVKVENGKIPDGFEMIAIARTPDGAIFQRPARVDERGQFLLEGLAPGEYEVSIYLGARMNPQVYGYKPDPKKTVTVGGSGETTVKIRIDVAASELVKVTL